MIKTITVITSIQSVWVTRPSRSDLGAIRACLGPVCRAWHKFCSFKASMRQYKYELICFRTTFCFANFSAPFNRTKMVLYSKCVYGSQFSGEENDLKIRSLVAEISIKNPVSFFLGHPVLSSNTQYHSSSYFNALPSSSFDIFDIQILPNIVKYFLVLSSIA